MKKKLSALLVCLFSAVLALALVACGGNLTISDTSLTLTAGDTKQLTLKDGETDVTKDAEWESSDTKIVTVDKGKVTAKSAGEATVKGSYKSSSLACTVTVKAKEVVKITFTDESGKGLEALTLERGESVTVKATTSNGSKVSWGIADPKYATVEETAENTAKITAKFQTPADAPVSVTATSGSGRGDLPLTVTYLNAPAGYYEIGHYEQNKVPVNTWGRWANQNWEGGGDIDMNISEYQDSADSEAGIATFNFTVDAHGTLAGADLQVVYRSAGKDGKLETGKQYALSMDVTSSMAGSITLNGMDFTIEAGKKTTITSYFLHADDGAIHEEGDWKNIYYTGVFLLLGNLGEAGDTIDFRIENVHWDEFTAEQLKAPTVTLSGNNATIADDVNTEGVAGYNLGLFVGDRQVYVIPDAKKGENSLGDLSKYEEAEYAVKAQAVGTDARYTDSPWSEGGATINVVHGGKTEYDVIEGDENQAKALPGLWYYSSEFGGMTNVKYASSASNTPYGEVSFEITNGGNWHSNQLFFVNSRLAAGRYVVKFTLAASGMEGAGKVHINGKIYTIENGDNAIEYRVEQNVGVTTVSIQMGEPDEGYQSTVSSVEKGTFTLKGFSFDAATAEKLATPTGLTIAEDGTVTITDAASNTGKVSGYKVLFCDAESNVKYTKLVKESSSKINLNSIANGTYYLKIVAAGDGTDYLDSDASDILVSAFKVEHGTADLDLGAGEEGTCEDDWVYWSSNGEGGCTVSVSEAKYSINEDETIDVSAKFSVSGATLGYGFQLFHNDASNFPNGTSVKVTLTATLNIDGSISLCGKTFAMKAGEAQQLEVTRTVKYTGDWQGATLFAMSINCEAGKDYELTLEHIKFEKAEAPAPVHPNAADYDLGEAITPTGTELVKGGEQDIKENFDKWYYWYVEDTVWDCGSVVTVTNPSFANGVFSITYNGGSVDYCTQLFYKASNLDAAKQYFLTVTIETDKAVNVKVNGEIYQLTAGTHNLTAIKAAGATSLSIQFDAVTEATTVKVSNVKWQEIKGGEEPEPPTPGTKYTPNYEKSVQGAEMTGQYDAVGTDNNPDTWVYWYVADATWNQGAPVTGFVAKFEGNAFVVTYKDGEVDYSVQVFYKNSALVAGQTYTLACKINASVETKAIINGKELTLNAGDNTVTVAFVLNGAGAANHGTSAIDFQFPKQTQAITLKISEVEWTAGDTTGGTQPETPAGDKAITVTHTEWYGNSFVKLSMSDEDFALVKTAANCRVNDAEVQPHGGNTGFLVDGTVLQVQLPEPYGAGKTYSVVWYDAQGNAIAHATFSYSE